MRNNELHRNPIVSVSLFVTFHVSSMKAPNTV